MKKIKCQWCLDPQAVELIEEIWEESQGTIARGEAASTLILANAELVINHLEAARSRALGSLMLILEAGGDVEDIERQINLLMGPGEPG